MRLLVDTSAAPQREPQTAVCTDLCMISPLMHSILSARGSRCITGFRAVGRRASGLFGEIKAEAGHKNDSRWLPARPGSSGRAQGIMVGVRIRGTP